MCVSVCVVTSNFALTFDIGFLLFDLSSLSGRIDFSHAPEIAKDQKIRVSQREKVFFFLAVFREKRARRDIVTLIRPQSLILRGSSSSSSSYR